MTTKTMDKQLVELEDDDLAEWFLDHAKSGNDMVITADFQKYIASRLIKLDELKTWARLVESEVDE
jgi:hypothetical protein